MNSARNFLQPTSRYSEAAIKLLSAGKPGDILTREQIVTAMDASDLTHYKLVQYIYQARRKLERDAKCWWAWGSEFGVLHCLTEQQAEVALGGERKRLGRRAKRALQRASCIDVSKLTSEQRRQFDLSVTQIALAKTATSTALTKRLGSQTGELKPPKLEDLAAAFK